MDTSTPLYARLKERIIRDVETGKVKPGDRLPSQRELCQQFKMSHMTVRRAIAELITEGVIRAIPGKGLYVTEQKYPAETSMIGFTGEMTARGYTVSSRILEKGLLPASTVIARALEIPVGSELAYLHRLRLVNNEPISLQYSYLVHSLCPGILELIHEDTSLYAVLKQVYKIELINSVTTVEATLANKTQADQLGLSIPVALLIVEQINYKDGRYSIEYSRLAYRGEKYVIQTQLQQL
jgi:DNA-binding GntR family transcriptional regulator